MSENIISPTVTEDYSQTVLEVQRTMVKDVLDRLDMLTNALLSNKQILNLDEASAFTGLIPSYLYKLTSTREIPHYKPRGKMLYFDRSELESWLRQNRVSSTQELEQKDINPVSGAAQ